MTVNSTTASSVPYLGNGSATAFPFPFSAGSTDEVRVFVDGVADSVAYSVVLEEDHEGGTVNFDVAPTVGRKIIISSNPDFAQNVSFINGGPFNAETHEEANDRAARRDIYLLARHGETLRAPEGEALPALPPPSDRLAKLLGFSETTGVRELLNYQALAEAIAPLLPAILATIAKGDPGGNIMAIGLFEAASSLTIPAGTNIVRTSGYSITGSGGAIYQYDAAVNSAYVTAHPRSAFVSGNGRGFRLSLDQTLNVRMFKAIGDDVTYDGDAFVYAFNFANSHADPSNTYGFGAGTPRIFVPMGQYYLGAQVLDIVYSSIFEGDNQGGAGGGASVLRWDAGVTGIRVQRGDTTGASTVGAQAWPGGNGSIIRNLFLRGGYAGIEGEFHGVHIRAHGVTVEQCQIENFQGDGILNIADTATVGGNANCFRFARNVIRNCRDGIHCDGDNSQAGTGEDNDTSTNRRWGINDSSFLGNKWHGISEGCGLTPGTIPTLVAYRTSGATPYRRYAVVAGQEAWASTHAPSGNATDNQGWYYCYDGAPQLGINIDTWVSGTTYRAGGPIRTDGNNAGSVIIGYYAEVGQGPMQLVWPTLIMGGRPLSGVKGVSHLRHSDTAITAEIMHACKQMIVGPTEGDPDGDGTLLLDSHATFSNFIQRFWETGVTDPIAGGAMITVKNASTQIYGNPKLQFFNGPTSTPTFVGEFDTSANFSLPAGSVVKIGGAQIIGPQQTGIPHNTDTDPVIQNVWINAIIDVLRAHGLIGP